MDEQALMNGTTGEGVDSGVHPTYPCPFGLAPSPMPAGIPASGSAPAFTPPPPFSPIPRPTRSPPPPPHHAALGCSMQVGARVPDTVRQALEQWRPQHHRHHPGGQHRQQQLEQLECQVLPLMAAVEAAGLHKPSPQRTQLLWDGGRALGGSLAAGGATGAIGSSSSGSVFCCTAALLALALAWLGTISSSG
jgi:hypothetical protein